MSDRSPRTISIVTPADGVSEALVRRLVEAFYAKVLADPALAPVFRRGMSKGWDAHLDTMVDFWSSVVLRTGRYRGKPHVAHAALPLSEALFSRWLALFEETAREVCEPDVAALFTDRAHRIAESLQIAHGIGPKALRLP